MDEFRIDRSSSDDWMRSLAEHHARSRAASPDARLLIVFDIDGTILDMRHMVCHVLSSYDRAHGTDLFAGLCADDVDVHENQVLELLEARALAPTVREHVHRWYLDHRWEPAAVLEAHRPYRGVMEVIRWLQLQPSTYVGLNTGRPEMLRTETLRSLNALGREYRVRFDDDLLHMNPGAWEARVPAAKVDGVKAFIAAGYEVLAVVDNEPENIAALAAADPTGQILFLHAQTLYQSRRIATPRTVEGDRYDLRALIGERDLPQHVQIVWHGVNDPANLRQFLASPVRWGEIDVRRSPHGEIVLRHDPQDAPPSLVAEHRLQLDDCLEAFRRAGKAIKLDIKDPTIVDDLLPRLQPSGLDDDDLWFNGRIDVVGEATFRRLAQAHPGAVLQCPVDFLGPLAVAVPSEAKQLLTLLTGWGIDRFSVSWANPHAHTLLDRLDEWGHDTNLYAVPDLEQFLRAVLLLPRSITADFNFPEWHYFGRGAGQHGLYHRYRLDGPVATPATDVA
jgi:phosphoglycolate phosphatase-like HAD superfamily hydrolase